MKSKLSIRLSIRIRRLEHCAPPPLRQCRRLLRPWPPQRRPSAKAYRRSGVLARALCGVPTERNPSTHPYPGLHPGLVCSAPLGHPIELSMALSRPVEATHLKNRRWLYLGSLRHCSLLSGDRLCVRGGQVLGTGCWEDAKCFRDRLLCCLGTGCRDRLGFEAAGRTPNILGTGCWE